MTAAKGMRWWGGKQRHAKWICAYLPQHCTRYVEPFAGMMSVLLSRQPVRCEIANDLDGRVVNWWTVVRDRHDELTAKLHDTPWARAEVNLAIDDFCPDDPVEAARRLTVYLWQTIYGSDRTFNLRAGSGSVSREGLKERIALCADRIRDVRLECRDALELLDHVSSDPDTLVYCDPPYPGTRCDHYTQTVDIPEMLDLLRSAKARVALSGYAGCYDLDWRTVSRTTTTSPQRSTVTETLWLNFDAGTDKLL